MEELISTHDTMPEVKYDKIGIGYNSTRQADPYLTERLLYHLQPKNNKLYLDIGCGTGNYTCALDDKGISFIGVEPSGEMLREATPPRHEDRYGHTRF
jgi:predicted TPR repeat methyltransferase